MQVFTYPLFYKILFRFGNIPLTILLFVYLIPSLVALDKNLLLILPVIISSLFLYFLNRQFIILYKIVPYKITVEGGKMICSDFLFSKRELVIFWEDISELKGGLFDGKLRGIQRVLDGKNKIEVGYFTKIKNSQKLGTIILEKVKKSVYDEVVEKIKNHQSK